MIPNLKDNTLIIAPHPDDEVLGCGGTIKKLTSAGMNVYILIITRGKSSLYSDDRIANVRREALDAHRLLGVTETRFLDFPAPELDKVSLAEVSASIYNVIKEFNIQIVYLPHRGDIHHDHKAVFNAGLVACRPNQAAFVKKILTYETLSETEWAAPFSDDTFLPTFFVNITGSFEAKQSAMRCYKSQLREFPNSRSLGSIEALARLRGSTVGFNFAEAFMTIRIVDN